MFGIPEVAIGTIVAALIAALVSLLGLIISKEQKISEFRQTWIDALRTNIADLISHANGIQGAASAGFSAAPEAWEAMASDFLGINKAAANIRLRLNPNEKPSIAVLKQLEELEAVLAPGKSFDYRRLDQIEKNLVKNANVVLKQEWVRVRSGERTYRAAKMVALFVVVVICVIALAIVARRVVGA